MCVCVCVCVMCVLGVDGERTEKGVKVCTLYIGGGFPDSSGWYGGEQCQ